MAHDSDPPETPEGVYHYQGATWTLMTAENTFVQVRGPDGSLTDLSIGLLIHLIWPGLDPRVAKECAAECAKLPSSSG